MQHRRKTLIPSLLSASLLVLSSSLWAQQDHSAQNHGDDTGRGAMMQRGDGDHAGGGSMQHGEQAGSGMMDHEGEKGMGGGMMMERMQQMLATMQGSANNSGQGAFDLIKQVVNQLESNPDTDWSKVNIELLRQHLVDMNQLTLYAEVEASEVEGGSRYIVTGDGITRDAIKRMVPMHAAQIQTELSGWETSTEDRRDGIVLIVSSDDPATTAKIRGLGFMGFMVLGEHHTDHHISMATGQGHGAMSDASHSEHTAH
ncbi:MAG: hypothetical protein DHS20C12_17860 [Pseudohongiella sp.]|nr:MAG: hypothetical protein DHS20C12_17860 [Pseudohongiella sp.]